MKNLNELLPIGEKNGQKAVNARDLHSFLQVGKDFSTWIKNRIDKYAFIEGKDFQTLYLDYQGNLLNIRLPQNGDSKNQQVSKIEYALSISMAKELSMIENNERGKQARKYFIACEENKHELSRKDLALMVLQAEEEKERLALEVQKKEEEKQAIIEETKPAVVFTECVKNASTNILVRDLAKLITQNGYTIGEYRLYDWLVENKYLIRHKRWSRSKNKYLFDYTPTQRAAEMKLFFVTENAIMQGGNPTFIKHTCCVTGKGQVYFLNKFKSLAAV
ncbi:antA/AntB antirepressor family protein [Bacteroides thetaiotaomicron]|uniref:antA/AntB antirepressor family protein n=1 Tax=Bacteroides thetaiotaomicron TaxID=818 RepID=UPI0018A1139C|nr:antA/AntB antirepressor family protein [Bacteroides thetaiotaomicron]